MSDYRAQIAGLYCSDQFVPAYRAGFDAARADAAEIASEADARIAELEAECARLRGAVPDPRMLDLAADGLRGAGIAYSDELNEAADAIRAALATTDAGAGTGTQ